MTTPAIVESIAEGIYESMYEGYYKPSWLEASPMDRFRCEQAANAVLAIVATARTSVRPYPIGDRPSFRDRAKERMRDTG